MFYSNTDIGMVSLKYESLNVFTNYHGLQMLYHNVDICVAFLQYEFLNAFADYQNWQKLIAILTSVRFLPCMGS